MALAVLSANRLHADLRLIAGQQAIDPGVLNALLRRQGLAVDGECILGGPVTPRSNAEFDRFDGELMFAASCQCAADALDELPAEDVICLLHPGDPDLRGAVPGPPGTGTLPARTDLRFVICTQAFKQHLLGRGFAHLAEHAPSFEPASAAVTAGQAPPAAGRDRFLFEVMAPVDRERFAIGLDAIEQALALGVLDPQRWDVLFAAPGLPQVRLRHGQGPTSLDHLDAAAAWQARQAAVLALRLPPPGAAVPPPLGVAAENAIVVVAADPQAAAAPGVINCELQRDGIVEALRRAVERLDDEARQGRRPALAEPALNGPLSLEAAAEQLSAGR